MHEELAMGNAYTEHKDMGMHLDLGSGLRTYACDTPQANFGVPSAHPTRHPAPRILLKLPLLIALPKSLIGPPSRHRSISTSRGTSALSSINEDAGESGQNR